MCKAVEELCKEEKYEATVDIVKRMLEDGTLTVEKIAVYSRLTLEKVQKLAEQQ